MRGALQGGVQSPTKTSGGRLWDFATTSLDGQSADLAGYEGRVALVVNVASKCGFTPQYAGLETLYRDKQDLGFVVLGFPSNDFMGQEPGTATEIRTFCTDEYGVTFPLFAKRPVTGAQKDEIYAWLTAGGLEEPSWNFTKYLVGRDGQVIARFGPRTKPDDPELLAAIDRALGE
ncbi:MAG: glutathione peroxidase [bacterium]|nr:glutathione peroxidase [bacterium]